jgi:hypothetical protein
MQLTEFIEVFCPPNYKGMTSVEEEDLVARINPQPQTGIAVVSGPPDAFDNFFEIPLYQRSPDRNPKTYSRRYRRVEAEASASASTLGSGQVRVSIRGADGSSSSASARGIGATVSVSMRRPNVLAKQTNLLRDLRLDNNLQLTRLHLFVCLS